MVTDMTVLEKQTIKMRSAAPESEQSVVLQTQGISEDHWWFKGRREVISSVVGALINGRSANIVEIGCGTGGNLKMLSKFGNVTAVEMNEDAASCAEELTGREILRGELPYGLQNIAGKTFDLVCLLDVLEHIENDGEALKEIRKILAPHGKLLISAPAYRCLYGEHDRRMSHYRRYSRNSMEELLKANGYNVVYDSYMNMFLFPAMLIARIFGKKHLSRDFGAAMPCKLINSLLCKVFLIEKKLLPTVRLPFGGTVLVVAESAGK